VVIHQTWDIAQKVNLDVGQAPGATEREAPTQSQQGPKLGLRPASAVDCYADLLKMGYAAEARDFAVALTRHGTWSGH